MHDGRSFVVTYAICSDMPTAVISLILTLPHVYRRHHRLLCERSVIGVYIVIGHIVSQLIDKLAFLFESECRAVNSGGGGGGLSRQIGIGQINHSPDLYFFVANLVRVSWVATGLLPKRVVAERVARVAVSTRRLLIRLPLEVTKLSFGTLHATGCKGLLPKPISVVAEWARLAGISQPLLRWRCPVLTTRAFFAPFF